MSSSQRQPVPYRQNTAREVEVIQTEPGSQRIINIGEEAKQIQQLSTIPPMRVLRRWIFVWLRVYVNETKHGKSEKVNISIPLPIPLLGATFARQLSFRRAARLANQARRGEIDLDEAIESTMGLEIVRVHEENPERGRSELVVVGLD